MEEGKISKLGCDSTDMDLFTNGWGCASVSLIRERNSGM
jgi:hypothetical protein